MWTRLHGPAAPPPTPVRVAAYHTTPAGGERLRLDFGAECVRYHAQLTVGWARCRRAGVGAQAFLLWTARWDSGGTDGSGRMAMAPPGISVEHYGSPVTNDVGAHPNF
eukprot:SAG11_NODE_1419_length_4957_cov_3.968711_6_plen_108_part_00